jgi:hypothetical protein
MWATKMSRLSGKLSGNSSIISERPLTWDILRIRMNSEENVTLVGVKATSLRIILYESHTALAIVDRFINVLKDFNVPTIEGEIQSGFPNPRISVSTG